MLPLTLAVGASVAWGASDFLGGLAARRLPVVVVLFGAQAVGLVLSAAVWSAAGAQVPSAEVLALGGAAGIAELLGFACLYRGLAIGQMSAVAPLAALTAVLPVAVSVGGGSKVAAVEAVGMLLAVAGTAVTAADSGGRRVARGAGLGIGAALCFGAFFVFLGQASEASEAGAAAVLSGRIVSVSVLALVIAAKPTDARPTRRDAGVIAALGALDVAANLAYAGAAAGGADATVAVLASLYPLTTVLLARALLHEHLSAPRLAGVVAVLGGVALISASAGGVMLPALLGHDVEVPCVDGRERRYVNLDNAASTPVMADVWAAVEAFVPWYSSVHRGSGAKSRVSTAAFEDARADVAAFVGARTTDRVVFVRNTTEAINVLAAALPDGARILSTPVEHHANMLPWRRHDVRVLPFTRSAGELLDACELALNAERFDLVAVTGASNVTGEVWPVSRLAAIAHRRGAELFVDAAQLAPHRPIDMAASGIDHLALSGHKLYAPFGAGALVAGAERLEAGPPLLRGGGAVKLVTLDDVVWEDVPERHEAGSPDVVGVVALAAACRRLRELGMDSVAAHERELAARLWRGLDHVPGLRSLRLWPAADRVGVAAFTLDGYAHSLLAAILSAEHAIGVRHGCFCAHPLMVRLLGISDSEVRRLGAELRAGRPTRLPGAVRASIGLGTTPGDIDRLTNALQELAAIGPRRRYRHVPEHDEYEPVACAPAADAARV